MSLYAFGAQALGGAVAGRVLESGIGATVSPSRIKQELETAATEVNTIHDAFAHTYSRRKLDPRFWGGWVTFYREFRDFYKSHQGYFARFNEAALRKAVEYRKRAQGWRDDGERLGVTVPGPKAVIGAEAPATGLAAILPKGVEINRFLNVVTWVGVGLVGVWVYGEFVRPKQQGKGKASKKEPLG